MTRGGCFHRLASALKPITAHGAALLAAVALAAAFPANGFPEPGDGSGSSSQIDSEAYVPHGPEAPTPAPPGQDARASPAPVDGVEIPQAAGGEAQSATGSTTPPGASEGNADAVLAPGSGVADDQSPAYAAKTRPDAAALPAPSVTAASSTPARARRQDLAHQVANGRPPRSAGDEPDTAEPPEPSGCEFVPMGGPVTQGTPGDDLITGTPGNDIICGFGGNDTIEGRGGDDQIDGGEGNDRIDGGAGDDCLHAGSGEDQLFGGNGDDRLIGGSLDAPGGNDELFGQGGGDVGNGIIIDHDDADDKAVRKKGTAFILDGQCRYSGLQGLVDDTVEEGAGFFASGVRRLAGTEAEAATPPAPLAVSVRSRSVTLKGRFVPVEVACSGPFLKARGTLTLATHEQAKGPQRKLGSQQFECRPFTPSLVMVGLSPAERRLVKREHRMQVRGSVHIRDLSGRVATARAVLTLRAPRR